MIGKLSTVFFTFFFPVLVVAQNRTDSVGVEHPADNIDVFAHQNDDLHEEREKRFHPRREKIVYRRVFKVNNAKGAREVFERASRFARIMNVHYQENRSEGVIVIPVQWHYFGRGHKCIRDLEIKATLRVEVKGLKTRISLLDINYTHFNKVGAATSVRGKSLFSCLPDCAPEKGVIELLYNCQKWDSSLEALTIHLHTRFNHYASQYQDTLRWY